MKNFLQNHMFFHLFHRPSAKSSFRSRLYYSFLMIIIPILLIIAISSSIFLGSRNKESILRTQNTELERLSTQIEYIISDTEKMSREIVLNSTTQNFLINSQNKEQYTDETALNYYINTFVADRDYINSIVITSPDTTLLSTERAFTTDSSFYNLHDKWWFSDFASSNAAYNWYRFATLNIRNYGRIMQFGDFRDVNTLMLARPIYSMDDYTTLLGYLMIYLNNDYIDQIWNSISWGNTSNVYIIDSNGTILIKNTASRDYSENLTDLTSDSASQIILSPNNEKLVFSEVEMSENDWKACMLTPLNEVNHSEMLLFVELLVMLSIMVLVLLIVSKLVAQNMSQPIVQLSQLMDSYHGDSSQTPDPALTGLYEDRTDEIGQMFRSYEQLADRLNHLIHEIYVKNLEKKDAELALLQSQINPHFLYNTLDSINWLALANDQDEISEMITALSDTFRLSLMKNNSPFVEIDQEIQYIKSYLMLQKFRYAERLHYEFDLPEPPPQLYLPRFILQPVIENALKHGIDKIDGGGRLTIRMQVNDTVTIDVYNDGTDIDLERMEEILFFDPSQTDLLAFKNDGYGVQNIHRRIKMICGDEYGIRYSVDETRTCCRIYLPLKTSL